MGVEREIRVEIGELELHGVPPARRFLVAASIERELARLIAENGLPAGAERPGPRPERPPSTVPRARERTDGNPLLLGQAIARSIYEGLA